MIRTIAAVALALLLSACAQAPIRNQLAAAADVVAFQADRTRALYQAGLITREDASRRFDQLQGVQQAVATARAALVRCEASEQAECPGAAGPLGDARSTLRQIDAYLIEQEKKRGKP